MALKKEHIAVAVAAFLVLLYYSPGNPKSVLHDDLLEALNNSQLNNSEVHRGLLAVGVRTRQDVVRLKKEVGWWFLENAANQSASIAKFTFDTRDALAFEAWLVGRQVPVGQCLKLLHKHDIRTTSDFSALNSSTWLAVFSDIDSTSPCDALVRLVLAEFPDMLNDEAVTMAVYKRPIWVASSFFGFWGSLVWNLAYLTFWYCVLALTWVVVIGLGAMSYKRKMRHRSTMEKAAFAAKAVFFTMLPLWLPFMILKSLWRKPARTRPTSPTPTAPPRDDRPQNEPEPGSATLSSYFTSSFFTGNYLDGDQCRIEWSGIDADCHEYTVGTTVTFEVKAFCRNKSPHGIKSVDDVSVRLTVNQHTVPFSVTMPSRRLPSVMDSVDNEPSASATGNATEAPNNSVLVTFFSRKAGQYCLDVSVEQERLRTEHKIFAPGPPDAVHSCLRSVRGCMAIAANTYRTFDVTLRDQYGNDCINVDQSKLKLEVCSAEREGARPADDLCHYLLQKHPVSGQYEIMYNVAQPGLYTAKVLFNDMEIQDGSFSLISLTGEDLQKVHDNIQNRNLNEWYEARMPKPGRKDSFTTVYIYVFPKQICIRDYYLYIIPHKLFAFRIRPSTKLTACASPAQFGLPAFSIHDTWQGPVQLMCKNRNIIMAMFAELLSKSIGGSESFEEKRSQFYAMLRQQHAEFASNTISVTVRRDNLLESARSAMSQFKNSWKKKWVVKFEGEEGLDYGGVSRELFHLLSSVLFDPNTGLFRRFNADDSQGLVHPNPNRPAHLKADYYKFAGRIVGRCLLESARGNVRLVSAHFTRSFLAQIIGLRINHTYFETDDTELFTSKIQYTLKNDVSDLEMVFAEEEYTGNVVKVIPLEAGGENKAVTNENKIHYLDLLAEYRLSKSTKDEIEAFLKGLYDIIPDSMLCMFDENELELLLCGVGNVSFDDLKKHSKLTSRQTWFVSKVVPWFWVIVSSFTQDELAKLLQFTTGSSQLPPGGFAELKPEFQISPAPVHGSLPTSHTCFNQLCLPDYDSSEDLQRALAMAINEGSEGFGMI